MNLLLFHDNLQCENRKYQALNLVTTLQIFFN